MAQRDTSRDVAIIGMACRFADADDPAELWSNVRGGRVSFRPIPKSRWNHDDFYSERFRETDKTYVKEGAFIEDVDSFPALWFGIAPRRVEVMDPQHRMILETTRRALEDAGLGRGFDTAKVGTFLGVSTSEYRNLVTSRPMAMMMAGGSLGDGDGVGESLSKAVENVAPISAFSMPGNLLSMAAANVASQFQFGGPAYTVDAACASSLVAVHDAVTHIRAGICDAAVAGGVYLNFTPETIVGFSRIGAISQKGACRPFDAEADGFLQGDGCGVVVLKSLDKALADGDRVWAVIQGSGINNDAGSSSGPMAPSLEGQLGALSRAYEDANVDPCSVGFVSCHGTATPVGDPVEVAALREVFGESLDHDVYLGSVKGNIGHTMSAAGVAGLIHTVLALHHGEVTPQAGFEKPHPALKMEGTHFQVPREPAPWPTTGGPRRAGVSAFGFGGTNCHFVLEEAPARTPQKAVSAEEAHAIVLTAGSRELLAAHAAQVAELLTNSDASLGDVAYTLSATRRFEPFRLAVVATSMDEAVIELRSAAKRLEAAEPPGLVLGPNSFWGSDDAGSVGFLFPGQGAQRVGLMRDLYERFPSFAARLDALSDGVVDLLGKPIRDFLYPEVDGEEAEAALTATEVCQPVMAALGIALAQFLGELGVEPAVVLGHSLGEFAAAGAAGLIGAEDAVRFVAQRGRLMADLALEDSGAMAAVMAGRDDVLPHLGAAVIANLNHPTQTVISGSTAAVEQAAAALEAAGIKATLLRVSHAFHSPVVAGVTDDLAALVDGLSFAEARCPVVSAITGAQYGDAEQTKATFIEHATATVDFMGALRAAAEQDVSLFVEVGAGTTLSSFAQGTLGDALRAVRSLGAKTPDAGRDFHRALAMLVAAGVDVNFKPLYGAQTLVALPSTPLVTSRHWVVRDKKVPLDVPVASTRGEAVTERTTQGQPSDELVALFREQNEILRQHAAIMAAQNAALGGAMPQTAVPVVAVPAAVSAPQPAPVVEASVSVEAPAPKSAAVAKPAATQQAATPTPKTEGTDYEALVFDAVAAVSAFPADALSRDQKLAIDLGFDSLMMFDLGADLQKRVPGLAIPQTLLNQKTTVGDLVAFLQERPAASRTTAKVEEAAQAAELRSFEVAWSPVPVAALETTPWSPRGEVVVTVAGTDAEAEAFVTSLGERGVTVRVADVAGKVDFAGATTVVDFAHRKAAWSPEVVVALTELAAGLWTATDGNPEAFVVVSDAGAPAATRGALRGFAKGVAREWPEARVASVEADTATAAHVLAELDDPAQHNEVRWRGGVRQVPTVVERSDAADALSLTKKDTVLITGGARGIGALCARAVIDRTPASVLLIGSSAADEHAALLKQLGSRARYLQWDVRTPDTGALSDVRPRVVVHAAGVIRDARVEAKSADDVRLVTAVKVDGLQNVLDAAPGAEVVIGFGSWAGRFGNAHQSDYSAANDAMSEMLGALAGDVRGISIDWPLWEGSAMAETIAAPVREMMRAQGVSFISPEEGVETFVAHLLNPGRGEVLVAHEQPRAEAPFRASMQANLKALPYVAEHIMRGVPVVPFATSLDWMATAAKTAGAGTGKEALVLRDVQLFRGIMLDAPRAVQVRADMRRGAGEVELHADGELAYRTSASFEQRTIEVPATSGDATTPQVDIPAFYRQHAFHGPKIQGIAAIEKVAEKWIVGRVKTSTPAGMLERETSQRWTIDPLVIDAAMQLVLFQLRTQYDTAAYPTGIDEYVQLREFVGAEVRCTMVLDEMAGGNVVGTIAFEDDLGLAALMVRLRAREFALESAPAEEPEIEIDRKFWDIAEFPEVQDLEQRLQMAELIGIRNPYFHSHTGPARNLATIEGREMINFSSYNYCGFSGHPEVTRRAQDAIAEYGTSVSASRIASGQIPLHAELEGAIASFIGTEASLVFSAGHMTNETCIGHLFNKRDLIIHDSLAHNSILTGAELSGAKRMQFPHSDYEALDRILRKIRGNYEKVGIFIEGVYSMDGDIPDLQKFIDVKRRHKALLYVDEAHSMGVIGPRGAGISDYFGIDPMDVDVWMGTLSKSFASCGGYVTGSKKLIEYLKYTAPAFVFSAGISPANAAAALASVTLLTANPEIPRTLQKRADFFLRLCREHGIDTGMSNDSAVVPCIVGNSLDCLKLSQRLADRGVNVQPIVYPAVEDESSRLRFFLSSTHTEDELTRTVEILTEELHNVRSGAAAE